MEGNNKTSKISPVHKILAHSYTMFFAMFLLGVCLDFIFKVRIFENSIITYIGFVFFVVATGLIFWAQKTSHDLTNLKEVSKENFCHGPYCYTSSPTHWGLFLLMVGYGILTSSFFIILTSCIALVISKRVFLAREERILAERYGAPYLDYKRMIKF